MVSATTTSNPRMIKPWVICWYLRSIHTASPVPETLAGVRRHCALPRETNERQDRLTGSQSVGHQPSCSLTPNNRGHRPEPLSPGRYPHAQARSTRCLPSLGNTRPRMTRARLRHDLRQERLVAKVSGKGWVTKNVQELCANGPATFVPVCTPCPSRKSHLKDFMLPTAARSDGAARRPGAPQPSRRHRKPLILNWKLSGWDSGEAQAGTRPYRRATVTLAGGIRLNVRSGLGDLPWGLARRRGEPAGRFTWGRTVASSGADPDGHSRVVADLRSVGAAGVLVLS